jgi:hypothetical protein
MPQSAVRRALIRRWMSLAPDQRRNKDQAVAFVEKCLPELKLPRCRREPRDVVLGWLLPRTGRA